MSAAACLPRRPAAARLRTGIGSALEAGGQQAWKTRFRDRSRRSRQSLGWMHAMLEEHVVDKFITDPNVSAALPGVELKVSSGVLPATSAVAELIALYETGKQR